MTAVYYWYDSLLATWRRRPAVYPVRLQKRPEVMNPPESAAKGSEARNLTRGHVIGMGLVSRGAKARPADVASVPLPSLCSDCPPSDYPTDKTRCAECPRSASTSGEQS